MSLQRPPPPVDREWSAVGVIDPASFGDREFQRDFAATHRILHTLALTTLPHLAHEVEGFSLGLFRGTGSTFSAGELAVLRVLYPHLENLFLLLGSPEAARRQGFVQDAAGRDFTGRETEVVSLLCQRLSVEEIAGRLFISRHTVEKHLEHIYAKLRVSGWRRACDSVFGGEPLPGSPRPDPTYLRDG